MHPGAGGLAFADIDPVIDTQVGQAYSQTNVANEGTTPYTYSLTAGTLPAGTTLSSSTGTVSGIPTAPGAVSYTITVTDSGSPTQTASNAVSGTIAPVPLTTTQAVASATLTVNSAATPFTPVTASGGTGTLTYGVNPALPTGLSFSTATGQMTGTPTASSAATTYTVTVTDQSPTVQTSSKPFSLTVNAALATTQAVASTTLTANSAATPFTPVTASGGTGTLTYGVSPALPAGLSFSTATGQVTGTPTASSAATTYTVTVTDQTTPTAQTSSKTFSLTVNAAASTTTVTSSLNPSELHRTVTFTAKVTDGGGTPTGTVTFKDGSTTLGTATLAAGSATFATSGLALGVHSITATYAGDGAFLASTSAALQQSVAVPTDSLHLRTMQIQATPQIASVAGQMNTGAIDGAISSGFSDNPQPFVFNGNGFTANLFAEPTGQAVATASDNGLHDFVHNPLDRNANRRVDDGFSALAYGGSKMPTKAAPKVAGLPREWLAWIDVRGMSVSTYSTTSDLKGNQVSALFGLTRKLSPDVLIGGFGGYEYFTYSSSALNSQLKGNGWTVGAFLGWRFATGLRFDIAAARSQVDFSASSGAASADFPAHRWLVSGGLTGGYKWQGFNLVPSARIYGLWEHEDGYTDSLTITQPDRNFSTGRASGGMKVGYPLEWGFSNRITPYAGFYGDYYFTKDDAAATIGAGTVPLLKGWSARATGGVSINIAKGASLDLGGEYGGIGSITHIWIYRGRMAISF